MSKIVVLDFETGGLDPAIHALMSVAAIQLGEPELFPNLPIVREYYTVIQDLPEKIITPEARAVNGITDEMILKNGLPIDPVLDDLQFILDDAIVCCHNAAFDVDWLNHRGFDIQEAIDTMFLSWDHWGRYTKAKLGIVCERAGIPVQDAHNSLGDTRMTVELLRYLAKANPEVLKPKPIQWKWWEKR